MAARMYVFFLYNNGPQRYERDTVIAPVNSISILRPSLGPSLPISLFRCRTQGDPSVTSLTLFNHPPLACSI
jgi:hypothetical protein